MSGRTVVPILEKHGDVYITGSTVIRHKLVNGEVKNIFPPNYDTQLVLSTKHLYKLHLPLPQLNEKKENLQENGKEEKGDEINNNNNNNNKTNTLSPSVLLPELVWRESIGLIRNITPLYNHPSYTWGIKKGELNIHNCHGFAIEYFTTRKIIPKPLKQQTILQKYIKEVQCRCVENIFTDIQLTSTSSLTGVSENKNGGFRVREFYVGLSRPILNYSQNNIETEEGSPFLEQDWCSAFKVAQINYWHERLEDSLISSPEVFQYQTFAMQFININFKQTNISSVISSCKGNKPLLCQLVLSTERIYIIPRYNAKLLSIELPLHHAEMRLRWFTVSKLQTISIDSQTGIIICTGQQQVEENQKQQLQQKESLNSVTFTIGFFTPVEAEEAVLEIQRVWELTHRNDDFPIK